MGLHDVADQTGTELNNLESVNSLPDFFVPKTVRIPKQSNAIRHAGHRFEVLAMDGQRVGRVGIHSMAEKAESQKT